MNPIQLFHYNGSKISYIDYGTKEGNPVLLMHSAPGSHRWFLEKEYIANRLGLRLIAFDRPGYGDSDYVRLDSFKDLNPLVLTLLNKLKIDKINIIGCSTGCAYSLAFAEEYPNYINKMTFISSVAPLLMTELPKGMSKINSFPFYLAHMSPRILLLFLNTFKSFNPHIKMKLLKRIQVLMSNADRHIISTKFAEISNYNHASYGLNNNSVQLIDDILLLSNDWNINFKNIKTPITFFHGDKDTLMPLLNTKQLSEQLNCENFNVVKNAGHFLLDNKEIWKDVLKTF